MRPYTFYQKQMLFLASLRSKIIHWPAFCFISDNAELEIRMEMTTFKMKTTSDVISVRTWVKKKNSIKRTLHIFSKLCETVQNCMADLFNFERNWWIGPFVENFEAISKASSFGVGVKCSWRSCTYCFMLSECKKDLSHLVIWNLHLVILHYLTKTPRGKNEENAYNVFY